MLHVVKAQTAHLAAEAVVSMIQEQGRHVVIAPDPFTLAVEKTISAKLGKKSLFNVEVMSFARLASVFLGESVNACLSPAGSVMLMEKVVRREAKNLIHYQKAAGKPGFAAEIYAAVTSIRNSGVTPQALYEIEGKLKGYVRAKTHDIAYLYDAYLAELQINHTDSTTRLEALARYVENSEDLGDVCFYVVDHVDLNQKQLEVLSALMKKSKDVFVAVADGAGAQNARIYPKLLKKLEYAAENAGVQKVYHSVPTALSGVKKKLADELFSYSFSSGASSAISLWEAKDAVEEVTLLATEIVRLVRKEGMRFSDVAVITPSFEEYLPVVERVFRAYGVPLFADRRVPLSGSDVFRHLMLAPEIVVKGYDGALVRKYVLHSLFEATTEEKAAFFDYLDKSGADRGFFKKKFDLFEEDELYPFAEKLREGLTKELAAFEKLQKTAAVREYAAAFKEFLLTGDFDARIEKYVSEVHARGLLEQAEVIRQVPQAMMELLDTLVELRGEETVEFKDFVLALTAGAGQVKIATLPVSLDCVYFAPVEQAMYAPIPALFVLGAEEGLFPLEAVGEGILGMTEYQAWQNNNIIIENVGVEELEQSRFHVVQLLLRGERTYLSHVESKNGSPCFLQIKEIFSLPVKKCADVLKDYDADVLIPTRQVAEIFFVEYSRRYREGLLGEKEKVVARAVAEVLGERFPQEYGEERVEYLQNKDLFFKKGSTSVSELESYFKCPFLHFVRYGIGAREKRGVSFDLRDSGIVVHECMKRFAEELKGNFNISDDEARARAKRLAEKIFDEPKYEPVKRQLGDRVVAREIRRASEIAVTVKNQIVNSSFKPALFEKRFPEKREASEKAFPPLRTVKIGGVPLEGQIDRVDVYKENGALYAAAIDYKTGSAKVASDELYVGKKIQLPAYLAVLQNSGYDPVAALYYSLSDKKRKGEQVLFGPKMTGETGAPLIDKLDNGLSTEPSPYTGVYYGKDGLTEKEKMLLTKAAFQAQVDYALAVASGAVKEIKEGYVLPTGLAGGRNLICSYCEAKSVCRHAKQTVRAQKQVSSEDIHTIMTENKEPENAD